MIDGKRTFLTLLKIIGMFFLIFVVFFAIGETCTRLFRKKKNPLVNLVQTSSGYLFPPRTTRHSSSPKGEYTSVSHINAYGYRGVDFDVPKKAGVIRIFAVGDSFTVGVGCSDTQTIPFRLEQKLKEEGFPVEVVNAGVGHAGTIQSYLNLRDIHLKYEPDLVILFFDLTDLHDDWLAERHAIFTPNGDIRRLDSLYTNGRRDWWATATHYSAFCRLFHNKVVRSFEKMSVIGFDKYVKASQEGKRAKAVIAYADTPRADAFAVKNDGMLFLRGRSKEALILEQWKRTTKYLTRIQELLRSRGIPLVIVMYPYGIYVDGRQWNEGRVPWGFEQGKTYTDHLPFELMAQYARDRGIPFINTLDDFLQAPSRPYFFDWDGHLTPEGNAIVSSAVASDSSLKEILQEILKRTQKP